MVDTTIWRLWGSGVWAIANEQPRARRQPNRAVRDWARGRKNRELKNRDEVHDDDVCWLGKDWNENVSFGGKRET